MGPAGEGNIVCLGWILFRAESFDLAMQMLQGLGRVGPGGDADAAAADLIGGGLAMHWLPPRVIEGVAERLKTAPSITLGLLIGAAIPLVEAVRPEGGPPSSMFGVDQPREGVREAWDAGAVHRSDVSFGRLDTGADFVKPFWGEAGARVG